MTTFQSPEDQAAMPAAINYDYFLAKYIMQHDAYLFGQIDTLVSN